METKKFLIGTDKESPLRRVLKNWEFWAFTISALVITVCEAIDGNWICGFWAVMAAMFKFFSDLFKGYADDFYELSLEVLKDQEILREALKEKDNTIAELQAENISLRFEKTSKE